MRIAIIISNTTNRKTLDASGKPEEVLGRTVRVSDDSSVCYRCGRPRHLRFNYNSKMACSSTVCSLCKAHIGSDNQNARNCCKDSARVFPKGARSDRSSKKKAGGKGRKSATNRGKSTTSSSTPVPPSSSNSNHSTSTSAKPAPYNTHGEAVKDLPREVVAEMATLNKFAKASGDLERRVAIEEDSSSSR